MMPPGDLPRLWQVRAPDWKWPRLALWDIAGNGAFTTPIWMN